MTQPVGDFFQKQHERCKKKFSVTQIFYIIKHKYVDQFCINCTHSIPQGEFEFGISRAVGTGKEILQKELKIDCHLIL